jgi:hypothetical protein
MSSLSKGAASTDVSREAVLNQLGRILASPSFQRSEATARLLRHIVEEKIAGRANGLKEYILGADGLGKGSSFDPRIDPIVRAEGSRLRRRLEKYYVAEGKDDPVVILLPKGSYLPTFKNRPTPSNSPDARQQLDSQILQLALRITTVFLLVIVALGFWRFQ